MVVENAHFAALVPFWAVWPFEVLLLSKRHSGDFGSLDLAMRNGLADIFKQLTTRYDNLFEISFPYSMGFHQSPDRWRSASGMASPRALLSAAVALGHSPQVHGRL